MSNEEYVRSVWVGVSYCSREETNSCCGPTVFIAPFLSGNKWTGAFRAETKDAAFAAVAEFTRKRLEQVRQLREEIALLAEFSSGMRKASTMPDMPVPSQRFARNAAILDRSLARLEAELATLTRGIRPEALEGATR